MTRTVVIVDGSAPFKDVVRLMQEYQVSALPVVDSSERLVGIVSEGDLILKEDPYLEGEAHLLEGRRRRIQREKAQGLVAGQVMTTPPVTVQATTTLGEAARMMHRRKVKRLPVVDADGKVIGIVSRADLLKVFLRTDAEIAEDVVDGIIRRTLWIDPATLRVVVSDGVVLLEGQLERRSLVPVLIGLVHAVEGVVGVEDRLSYSVDDVSPSGDLPMPWAALSPGNPPR